MCPIDVVLDDTLSATITHNLSGSIYVLSGGALPSSASSISMIDNWPYGTTMDTYVSDFDFAYDHLYHPLGVTGTYGIIGRIEALSGGQLTVNANKNKQDAINAAYMPYTEWTVTVSGAHVSFYDDGSDPTSASSMAFTCDSDMTSTFTYSPSGRRLLVDCGVDKQKGCEVLLSYYTEPQWTTYTEVTITINPSGYTSSPALSALYINFDNPPPSSSEPHLETINISGSGGPIPISGATYQDVVTFIVVGDQTSTYVHDLPIICTYDSGNDRYFLVYESQLRTGTETLINRLAGKTLVKLTNGIPITTNITSVSIVP
jgi:hypothetical protein